MIFSWFRRKGRAPQADPKRDPKATRDLSPDGLAEAAKRRDVFELVELLLVRKVETELRLAEKQAEVTLRTAEAEATTKLKVAELREQARQLRASRAAERNRTHPRDAQGRILPNPRAVAGSCPVCSDPGSPYLTVEQIRAHHAGGHPNGGIPAVSNSKPSAS